MTKIFSRIFFFGIILIHLTSQAQEINFEFAAPIDKIVETFGASAIQDTLQIGVASVKITDDRIGKFRQVAPPNLLLIFEQLDNPTKVRELVQVGMEISKNRVSLTYVLIDDRDGFVYDELSPLPLNGKNPYYIWPGFGNSDGGVDEKSYDGWVYIGETKAAEFVKTALSGKEILSQLSINQGVRAQFLGNDTDHWGYVYRWNHGVLEYNPLLMEEPLNDMGTAVEEGTGYFFTNLYNERERRELLKFLSVDTSRYLVGKESPLAKSSDWIEKLPKIERAEFNESAWKFEWTTLPPDKILYAGSTTAGLYTFFWKYSKNKSLALELITAASHKMWNDYEHRNLFYAVTHLAMELERYADTPLGELDMKSGQITSSMVPYALLDLMTRFGLDKNMMDQWIQALPKEQRPLAYDAYWGKYHSQIFRRVGHVTYSKPMPLEESVSDIFQFFDKKEMILSQPYSPR